MTDTTNPLTLPTSTALVVVDVQHGFDDADYWGPRNNPAADRNIGDLVTAFTSANQPIVFVQHDSTDPASPLHPTQPGNRLKSYLHPVAPDLLVRKAVNSSFHGKPDLHEWLQARHVEGLVVCGITTNHCCETTARVAGNLGYQVFFAIDATHTFDRGGPDGKTLTADELVRASAANLHEEFATVTFTKSLVVRSRETWTAARPSPVDS